MNFTIRVLIGLIAGFALGLGVAASHSPWLARVPEFVEPVGLIWVNAIRLAVIPLVVSSVVVAVAQAGDARRIGRLAGRALALMLITVCATAVVAVAAGVPAMRLIHLDPQATAALSAGAPRVAAQAPSIAQWFVDLVPVNVIKSAADGALLPMIVFSVAFGLALIQVEAARRATVLNFFQGVYEAFLVIMRAVIALAPIGVFGLAVPLAAKLGLGAAGALAAFVVLVSAVSVAVIVLLYFAALVFGQTPLGRFGRACAPAQAVTFTSRSSLAALPAAYEGARDVLGLPREVCDFFVPLGVSIFRVGAVVAQILGVLFLAKLYGVPLGPSQIATVAAASMATSFTVPGIPAGTVFVMAPVLTSVGVPTQGIGILLAVDAIPDMFRTTANVTGTMAVAAILGRNASQMANGKRQASSRKP